MDGHFDSHPAVSMPDQSKKVLTAHAIRVCEEHWMNYIEPPMMGRKLITHYCCDRCKFRSLSNIDFRSSNKPRCCLCGMCTLGGQNLQS